MTELSSNIKAPILGINRLRIGVDGHGVTTLVAFMNCPLRCKYCLNDKCYDDTLHSLVLTPEELYERVKKDDLYFRASDGGITFGGGEPALFPDFISEFRKLCGQKWKITLETSLNVSKNNLVKLLPIVDKFIVDIKDMHPRIYREYTGVENEKLIDNLNYLVLSERVDDTTIRVPHIPEFNTDLDVEESINWIKRTGFTDIDEFHYIKQK